MKKVYLLVALGGLLLASCANDDLVVKPDIGESTVPISFNMKIGNQSRATESLETVMDNFGVWAFKANQASDLQKVTDFANSPMTVIPNYRVNYLTSTNYGSHWNYVTADWTSNPLGHDQWLKYWDGSYANTYFFGYGPHSSVRTAGDVQLSFSTTAVEATMTFPALVASSDAEMNLIYSNARIETNNNHIPTAVTVPLQFNRIPSQLKIAIYEEIPGYDVVMETLTFKGETDVNGVAAIPADYTAPTTWVRGSYLNAGTPTVVYSTPDGDPAFSKATLSFANAEMGSTNLNFNLPAGDATTGFIGNTYATRSFSETVYNVMPNGTTEPANVTMATAGSWKANSGLQFVMNYKLVSQDTKEEIHVKGARVYVEPKYTSWNTNTIYTYVFKITKNTSGSTTADYNVNNNPEQPVDALYPIIFDGVEIVDIATSETEWLVNGVEFSTTSLTLAPNAGATFGYTYDGTALTWTSTDVTVTTELTPIKVGDITYPGTATVTAGTTAGRGTIKATNANGAFATCEVVITTGLDMLTTGPLALTVGASSQIDFVSTGAVTWTSGTPAVATVDASGKVTALTAGTATITGTLGSDATKTVTLTVNVSAAP